LLHATVAVAPGAFEAVEAVPVALICVGGAGLAESAFLKCLAGCGGGVVLVRGVFGVSSSCQHVRPLVLGRPSACRSVGGEALVGFEAEAVPMVAALAFAVARLADVEGAVAAFGAVVVQVVLDAGGAAAVAVHCWGERGCLGFDDGLGCEGCVGRCWSDGVWGFHYRVGACGG